MALDRLVRIGRTSRQIPALPANEARERELVKADQSVRSAPGRDNQRAHGAGAAASAASRAAICAKASATASKVNNVEAWRAL